MKTSCFTVVVLAALGSLGLLANGATNPETTSAPVTAKELAQGYRDNVVLAKPRAARRATAGAEETREGMRVRRHWDRFDGLRLLELPPGETPARAIARLLATGRYEYVQPDSIRYATATPNDADFARQWAHANNGSNNGIAGADIKATAAWDVRTDASNIIVAVLDSGVRYDHPDLAANMWVNPREIPGNGIDDDGNGYIDDVHGINAITNNGNPNDDLGHGTHVAGVIGAVGNNGIGIAGVAWRVQIMALKFLRGGMGSNAGGGFTSDAIECVEYAIRHGAHIINASYGAAAGPVTLFDRAERDVIMKARDAGIIFVAAAGNDGSDMDLLAHYPSSYRLENVISVGNSTARDDLSISSNFGSGSVELFAPGTEIFSLWHQQNAGAGLYATRSGTSMAAPHVAGALALLKAQFPGDTYRQLINRVLRHVDPIPAFAGRVQSGGRLNLDRAMRSTDNRPFNDDFATRARLRGTYLTVRSVNSGATSEAEPSIAGNAAGATLWWEWTPAQNATVRVSTDGSSYDTLLGVFSGNSLAGLAPVAANDDEPGKVTSRVEFSAQAGVTYQIVVGGKGGAHGLTLLDIGAIPPNDNFANAQEITGRSALVKAVNAQATLEPGEPRILGFAGGKSLWYRWTAPAAARFQFALGSDGFDPLLAVYTGTSLDALTPIGSSDDADREAGGSDANPSALVTLTANAGTTYFIQVDGKAAGTTPPTSAAFTLTLNDSLWQGIAAGSITSAPTVAPDGSVYVGSIDGFFHAFNADGSRRWPAINLNRAAQDTSAAALAPDGTLYFGSGPTAAGNNARLFAYDSVTGARKWDVIVGNGTNANNAVALGADGTIYLHSEEGRLFAFTDHGTGASQKWSANIPGNSYASATIASDGTLYLGSDDPSSAGSHRLFAVDPDNGSIKWSVQADNPIYTATAIDPAGNVYFGTLTSGRLYSVTRDGAQRWIYTGARLGSSSSPALSPDGGAVYFAGYDGFLHAVNTADGTARWTFRLGDEVRASSPAVDSNGVIYVGCYDGLIYAVNPDGSLGRTWSTGGIVRSSPAIAGTTLYVGSNDKRLYAFDIGAGTAGPWPQFRHNARRTGRAVVETFAITSAPESQVAVLGLPFSLNVVATGQGPLAYEWKKDGVTIAGATSATYAVGNVSDAVAGTYTATVTGPQGSITTAPAMVTVEPINRGRLTNLSVRTLAGTGAQTLTIGFVVAGSPEKPLLIRAIGPTLADFGVLGVLDDPRLQLFSGSTVLATNDRWAAPSEGGGPAAVAGTFALSGAFALDSSSRDAAIVREMSAGAYTAQVTGASGAESSGSAQAGIALAELYDPAPAEGSRLVNVSARAQVSTGSGVLIAGFNVSGNVPKQVLIRGVGPALAGAPFGVAGVLANPRLDLYRGQTLLQGNDDWGGTSALVSAFAQVGAFALPGAASRDAALLVTLAPGSYTALVSGVNNTTGVALIEVYEMP